MVQKIFININFIFNDEFSGPIAIYKNIFSEDYIKKIINSRPNLIII